MSERDDHRDLSGAFEALRAPRSTAGYAQRAHGEAASPVHRWPQVLAGALAVLVALAGAGTFLALRNLRQNTAAVSSSHPPARTDAVMAYDSTTGETVMYGGVGASNMRLRDTWLWNGTTWRRAAQSGGPGLLASAHMSDDPADGGVLLIGVPDVPVAAGGGVSGCVTGVSGTGSATAAGGPGSGIPPARATTAPRGTVPASPPPCAAPAPTASQTWLFTAQGWHRAGTGLTAVTPALNAELGYDGASHEVVAAAPTYFPCGGPLGTPGLYRPLMIPCEAIPATSTAPGVACPLAAPPHGCGGGGLVATWAWANGRWTAFPAGGPDGAGDVAVVSGKTGEHARLVVQTGTAFPACPTVSCGQFPTLPSVETWRWTGSEWQRAASGLARGTSLALAGAVVTGVDGTLVIVGADGSTRTLDLRSGALARAGMAPQRTGEAIAEGPSHTLVFFGGVRLDAGRAVVISSLHPGSDTWRWDGRSWTQVGGAVPPAPPAQSSCPATGSDTAGRQGCPLPSVTTIGPAPVEPPASSPATSASPSR